MIDGKTKIGIKKVIFKFGDSKTTLFLKIIQCILRFLDLSRPKKASTNRRMHCIHLSSDSRRQRASLCAQNEFNENVITSNTGLEILFKVFNDSKKCTVTLSRRFSLFFCLINLGY